MKDEGPKLVSASAITRRRFCQGVSVGVVTIALPACFGDGVRRVSVNGLSDTDGGMNGPPPDLAGQPPPDLAGRDLAGRDLAGQPPPDLSLAPPPDLSTKPPDLSKVAGNCPNGVTSTNLQPGAFAANTAKFFGNDQIFVCRDGGGLFALTSSCPHAGCDVVFRANSVSFNCPCHGANFAYNGDMETAPAFSPLQHYALCIAGDGTVAYDLNSPVAKTTRLVA